MKYLEYMTAAYIIIWAAIFLYFLNLSRKEKTIWEELQALREILKQREDVAPSNDEA